MKLFSVRKVCNKGALNRVNLNQTERKNSILKVSECITLRVICIDLDFLSG